MYRFREITSDVWLMNNHKWALYCWEYSCDAKPASLIHLDWHWDNGNDFREQESIERLKELSLDELLNLIDENVYVTWDSFITPAVIRKLINEIHFFCFQESSQPRLDDSLRDKFEYQEKYYEHIKNLVDHFTKSTKPFIFDLDLDLFNRHSQFFISEDTIEKTVSDFIDDCAYLIKKAEVVTIAKSPKPFYIKERPDDWDKKLANKIADVVISKVLNLRRH